MEIKQTRSYYPYIFFAIVTLAVMLPLFAPGFVLTLDMVFTPRIRLPGQVTSSYLFYALLHLLNLAIPADILQKLMLASIVFLSGLGGYRLVERIIGRGDAVSIGAYIGGLLYAVNPYAYDRFMAGQFAVLLGYALLPFVAVQLLELAKHPTWRRSLTLGLLITGVGIVSIHTLGLVAALLIVVACDVIWQHRHQLPRLSRFAAYVAMSVGIFFIFSVYWLIPTLAGANSTSRAINGFTTGDEQAFATLGDGFIGQLLHILRLQGFWAENTHMFVLPQAVSPIWSIGVCLLWALVVIGAVAAWKNNQHHIALIFGAAAVIGAALATGALNQTLGSTLPLFRGFREPQKFTGLVALAFAVFAGLGAHAVREYLSKKHVIILHQAVIPAALLVVTVLTPTMFWGFGGQLHPVQYPATWASINKRLDEDKSSYQVLFLPWHLYMYYRFADRIIMSPAASYFDVPVIASNNPEIGKASADRPDARKTLLNDHILPGAPESTSLGGQLAGLHIKYIILDKDNDFRSYAYLDQQHDLRLISENTNLKLYLNTAFGG